MLNVIYAECCFKLSFRNTVVCLVALDRVSLGLVPFRWRQYMTGEIIWNGEKILLIKKNFFLTLDSHFATKVFL
jgi:hypothetical protein